MTTRHSFRRYPTKCTMRAAAPRDGSIVNIASRSGLGGASGRVCSERSRHSQPQPVGRSIYAAEEQLTVRCNAVHPAMVLTPVWDPMLGDGSEREDRIAALVRDTPLQRAGTTEDVAPMVVFLGSSKTTYGTSADFVLDGGLLGGSATSPRERH